MAADYPGAIWMPAYSGNYRVGRPVQSPQIIVDHCTDGHPSAENVGEMWGKLMAKPSSAHFCVGNDGTIVQAVRLADTAWHAHGVNPISIGVEHSARTPGEFGPGDIGLAPTMIQYQKSAALHAWLCTNVLKVAPSRVVILGHSEADTKTTHARCPMGCGWNWTLFMNLVLAEYQKVQLVA